LEEAASSEPSNLINTVLIQSLAFIVSMRQKDSKSGESEVKKRGKKRGSNERLLVDSEFTPWKLLPTISYFQINRADKNVKNLILELFGLNSNYYEGEPVSKNVNFEEMIHYKTDFFGEITPVNDQLRSDIEKLNWLMRSDPQKGFNFYSSRIASDPNWFMLNLVNWKPNWYQELSMKQLVKIIKGYKFCTNTSGKELPGIREVWIEDGKKWRVLAVAEPGVRLFLSGLTKFLMYYFDGILDRKIFHGFMHCRGVTTYWKEIFNNKYLEKEIIIEMDFSACFNNIRKRPLIESLIKKYNIPTEFVEIIVAHINAEIIQKPISELPSDDGKLERFMNKDFSLVERNLIQGLPLCPLLCNLAIKNGFDELIKELGLGEDFKYLTYADDVSFYLTRDEFNKLGGYDFVNKLNKTKSFKRNGLLVDLDKSSVVKDGEWKKDLKLLGLKYNKALNIIRSETRGRVGNALKGVKPLGSTSMVFEFKKVGDNFYENLSPHGKAELDKYLPGHQEIRSLTYESVMENNLLKKYFNTLVSYLYKGSEKVYQNFSISNCMPYSILWKIIGSKKVRLYLKELKINIHVISYFMIVDLKNLLNDSDNPNLIKISHKRLFKNIFISSDQGLYNSNLITEFTNFLIKEKSIGDYSKTNINIGHGKDEYYKKAKKLTEIERKSILESINLNNKLDETKG
jgi:hypothetical protein